ncbi:MAG: hypothetical protein HRU37_05000, partial [Roseibacillus sp.]|nr:hypothetical protein [Roseibacillus sp.]
MLTSERWFGRTIAIAYVPQFVRQRSRDVAGTVMCALLMVGGFVAATSLVSAEPSEIVQRELKRRAQTTQQAQEALLAGDKAYRLADYATAVDEYTKAFNLFPGGVGTAHLKTAVADRLAQASVERARELARVGDYGKADELLENVLRPGVAPHHAPAGQMREQLKDPIRNNPALTPAHARKVDEVRRLLYEARGFAELGQFDRALVIYDAVLRVDPHNTAARRGMEAIHQHKNNYFNAARDETREQMLKEVGRAWESPAPKSVSELADGEFGGLKRGNLLGASASEKLESIIIPVVDMD